MTNERQKTAFVTGASGFTGSHLCRRLVERGYNVRAMVRPSSKLDVLQDVNVELVYGDLAECCLPDGALDGVDTVYNIAAVYRKERAPRQHFFDVNAAGAERLLQAALEAGVSRFVHCSTVGVLGDIQEGLATEESPYNPHDVYQHSKLEGEKRALEYYQEHRLPVSVVRPGAIYGPGDLRFLKLFRAINKGFFWMIGSGENFYHLVYIEDLIDGMIQVGESEAAIGEVFILAGEEPVQVKDLVNEIAMVLGRTVPARNIPVRPVMMAANVVQKVCQPLGIEPPLYPRRLDFFVKSRAFDISKAKEMLGFRPHYDLHTGLACTAEWYRQNGYL